MPRKMRERACTAEEKERFGKRIGDYKQIKIKIKIGFTATNENEEKSSIFLFFLNSHARFFFRIMRFIDRVWIMFRFHSVISTM